MMMTCYYQCLFILGFVLFSSGTPYRLGSSSSNEYENEDKRYNTQQNKRKYTILNEKPTHISFVNMGQLEAVERLRAALIANPVDKEAITSVLLNWEGTEKLQKFYNEYYGGDLQNELERKLEGPFMRVILSLLKDPRELDAYWINQALEPINKDTLIGIFAALNNEDLADVNTRYDLEYRPRLLVELKTRLKGDFKDLMFALAYSYRQMEGWVDEGLAKKDAMNFAGLLASTPPKVIFRTAFSTRSFESLRATFDYFEQRTNISIKTFITEKFTGDFQKTLLAIASRATDKVGYFTNLLHTALSSPVNDQLLTWIATSQPKTVLREIGERYASEYGSTMEQMIRQKTSGSYRQIILNLLL